jgi:hypothetical protein
VDRHELPTLLLLRRTVILLLELLRKRTADLVEVGNVVEVEEVKEVEVKTTIINNLVVRSLLWVLSRTLPLDLSLLESCTPALLSGTLLLVMFDQSTDNNNNNNKTQNTPPLFVFLFCLSKSPLFLYLSYSLRL